MPETNTHSLAIAQQSTNDAVCPFASIVPGSTEAKVATKTIVTLSLLQFDELKWLLRNYGLAKPGWLTTRFKTNQRRTAFLNTQFANAGLDAPWCQYANNDGNWANEIHKIWHSLNPRGGSR